MLNRLLPAVLCSLLLGGCGSEPSPPAAASGGVAHQAGHQGAAPAAEPRFGTTVGTIVSVNPDLREIILSHRPFTGIEMGAMTMGFDVAPGVDITAATAEARVAVRVRQNPDFSFAVVALCATEADSVECLGNAVDPSTVNRD